MGNKMKKLICALLASAMLVSSVGMVAMADEVTTTDAATETAVEATEAPAEEAAEETEATEAPAEEAAEEAEATEAPAEEAEATEAPAEETEATEAPAEEAVATEAPAEPTEAPVVTGSAYDNDTYYQKALALCSALGIITGYEDGSVKPDSKVTRAEMASIVLRMLAINSSSTYQGAFTDVTSAHWAADQIQTALEASIVSGMGDGTFVPDGEVTYAQVIVMLVNALNYQNDAEYYGSNGEHWASGYLKVADDLDLIKNAPGSNDVASDRGVVIKMVYNALLADYKQITGYENGSPKYSVKEGQETLANAKFELIEKKGVVTATTKTSISGTELQENQVEILDDETDEKTVFECTLTGLEDYLAQKVTYYYKENSGYAPEVLAVTFDSSKTQTVEADAEDIETVEGFNDNAGTIKIDGVSKKKDCSNATIIYNGKMLTAEDIAAYDLDSLLLPEVGNIKLVDSDKDDVFDVIFVDSYETMVVSSASTERLTGVVSANDSSDVEATQALSLNLDDSVDRVVTVTKEGVEVKVRNLKKDDVATIRRSLDNTVVDIVVTGESIIGTATGISVKYGKSYATVNGERYDVANIAAGDLKTGTEGTFYFDMFGRIALIEASTSGQLQSGEKYGWIMNGYASEDGSSYIIEMYTQEGAKELKLGTTLDFWAYGATEAETISSKTTVADTVDAMITGNKFMMLDSTPIRLVKYKANSSGAISRLYCAVNSTVVDDEDALRINPSNLQGVAVVSGLVSGYKIEDGIMEWSVPKVAADMKNADNYKIGEVTSTAYVVRENGSSRTYVIGEFTNANTPSLLINFTASADALANLGDIDTAGNNPVMLVEEVSVGVDDEDNTVYTVSGFVNGAEASFTTTKNTVLGKINTSSAVINNARDYSTTALWDAQNGGNGTYAGMGFQELIQEGDLVLYDTGDRLIQLLDADDVYNVVTNGASKTGLLFGGFNPFIARNMFAFGAVLEADLDDAARIELDTSVLNTLQFDSSKLMDTVEININNGKATIDEEGSEISDVVPYDAETGTGDYVYARFADKGSLQEVVVYRFVD